MNLIRNVAQEPEANLKVLLALLALGDPLESLIHCSEESLPCRFLFIF